MLKEKNITDASTQELSEFSKKRKPVMSSFLATSHRIAEFSNNRTPKDGDRIVYIAGVFDILHIGIIETLKQAKMKGDFLYVGVYDDDTSQKSLRGKGYPILNLNERVFNLLALKYVDEVIIGAPYTITEDMMKHLKVDVVVEGVKKGSVNNYNKESDPYEIPKKVGKYEEIQTEYDMSNDILIDRLEKNKDVYIKKYLNKAKKDEEFFGSDGNKEEVKEV
jgi:ethanolamine-phosphate cytidylyltransferase